MNTRYFIGYDWFKLSVVCILGLMLFWAFTNARSLPAPTLPAAPLPAAPQLTTPAIDRQVLAGPITFSGTADPGANILVRIDNIPAGLAHSGEDGRWALETTLDQPGEHTIVVQRLDNLGIVIASADPVLLTVAAPIDLIAECGVRLL